MATEAAWTARENIISTLENLWRVAQDFVRYAEYLDAEKVKWFDDPTNLADLTSLLAEDPIFSPPTLQARYQATMTAKAWLESNYLTLGQP